MRPPHITNASGAPGLSVRSGRSTIRDFLSSYENHRLPSTSLHLSFPLNNDGGTRFWSGFMSFLSSQLTGKCSVVSVTVCFLELGVEVETACQKQENFTTVIIAFGHQLSFPYFSFLFVVPVDKNSMRFDFWLLVGVYNSYILIMTFLTSLTPDHYIVSLRKSGNVMWCKTTTRCRPQWAEHSFFPQTNAIVPRQQVHSWPVEAAFCSFFTARSKTFFLLFSLSFI